jgi:hypothetical protein
MDCGRASSGPAQRVRRPPPERAELIVDDLAGSTATGVDGYQQRFGIPDGLYAEPVAVKQGWMCCIGSDWMHLSTGVIGPDRR